MDSNKKALDEKLHSKIVEELESKKDWRTLLAVYEKLLTIFPDAPELHKRLKNVHKQIEEGHKQERITYFKEAAKKVEELIAQNQLDQAEQACYEILALNSTQKNFIHLLAHIQHLQDKAMDQLLDLYFKEAIPKLEEEYKEDEEKFIHV